MADAVDSSDSVSDLIPVDPLDLEEIAFSCVSEEKETNEFDYGDDIFQQPKPSHETEEAQAVVCKSLKREETPTVECLPPAVETKEKESDVEIHDEGLDPVNSNCPTEIHVTPSSCQHLEEERQETSRPTSEVCQITVEFVGEDSAESNNSDTVKGTDNSALAAAQDEWDKVECVEAGYDDPSQGPKSSEVVTTPLITFNEALQHFQNANLQHLKPGIQTTIHLHGFSALKYFLFGPPALSKDLVTEKEMAFCIAASEFENDNEVHLRVLQTVYRTLTGSKFDCPRYGSHYEEIGFQGTNPATDLRGCGFLGLMHILHLLTNQRTLPLAREIYKLSMDETQNFPFCLMGINISRITLQATREGCLNKECNRRKQVVAVMNDFYVGTYLHLFNIWKYQHKTISDSGFVLKQVERFAKKNPKSIMKQLESYLTGQKDNSSVISNSAGSGDQVTIDKLP